MRPYSPDPYVITIVAMFTVVAINRNCCNTNHICRKKKQNYCNWNQNCRNPINQKCSEDRHIVLQGNVLQHLVLLKRIVRSCLFIATYNTTSYHVIENYDHFWIQLNSEWCISGTQFRYMQMGIIVPKLVADYCYS